jgi:hypothetical protein
MKIGAAQRTNTAVGTTNSEVDEIDENVDMEYEDWEDDDDDLDKTSEEESDYGSGMVSTSSSRRLA